MSNFKDLTNEQFGRLTALKPISKINGAYIWLCHCSCGIEVEVCSGSLKSGRTSSCGCLQKELARELHTKHGFSHTPEYNAWINMKLRCTSPKCKYYKDYGGRGIQVCERWRESFENFLSDMGKKPSPELSIDRINNDGNYEPGNCRWATKIEQTNNRKRKLRIIPARIALIHKELLWNV
jgi:hypothetical protein